MELHTWTAFVFASILIAVSPGSGAVLSMSHGLTYGVKRSQATIVGLELGLVVILLIAGAGVGSLLVASEVAFNIVKISGALYLIYVGWAPWTAKTLVEPESKLKSKSKSKSKSKNALNAKPAGPLTWRKRCAMGFLTNVTNPKGIVFMVAVLPQFISPYQPLWLQLLVMAVTMISVDTLVMSGYAYAASALQHLFRDTQALRIQNRVFGGILMAVGTGLFFVKRQSAV